MPAPSPIELSLREPPSRLFDEPFVARAKGDGGDELLWRARYRDDDGRVWKAAAPTAADLASAWQPAKPQTGPIAALQSLRPVTVDLRVEAADGRAAGRQVTRHLLAPGVRPRRWRDGLTATLYLPTDPVGSALLLDATPDAGSPSAADATSTAGSARAADSRPTADTTAIATPAAALLASRGVLVLAVFAGDVALARERLAAVPSAPDEVTTLPVLDPYDATQPADGVLLPPGVGARDLDGAPADVRAAAWDALLERLRARPRVRV